MKLLLPVVLILITGCAAKRVPAPLPPEIKNAVLVWVQNNSDDYTTFDFVYKGVGRKWTITPNMQAADLLAFFSYSSALAGQEQTTVSSGEGKAAKRTNTGAASAAANAESAKSTTVTGYRHAIASLHIQAKSGEDLLVFSCGWTPDSRALAYCLLKQLDDRFK